MIATIDSLRNQHNDAAMRAASLLADLAHMIDIEDASAMEARYLMAIDAINAAADAAIEQHASPEEDAQIINVDGTYIAGDVQVGGDFIGRDKTGG